jgi:hypothetical protein
MFHICTAWFSAYYLTISSEANGHEFKLGERLLLPYYWMENFKWKNP